MSGSLHKPRLLAGALVLLALLYRAMVPVGSIPSGQMPFALKICPEGLPTPHAAHHGAGHSHVESCAFASLPGDAPHSHEVGPLALPLAVVAVGPHVAAP